MGICLQNRDPTQKFQDEGLGRKDRGDHCHLRIHPVKPRRGDDCSGELDRLVAPFGLSPLNMLSTGCNTWIAPTDKGSVMEELDKEDEEDEGREGIGEGGAEEEDVERDREDMTNLLEDEESSFVRRRVFGCRSRKSRQ